ncbi:Methylated-DNA/protein-cysteinemethyltransferase OS=Tsukamurella paurometabola (strain ATCC 8368 /DSM / CCUG 35730 / CIP 100753 / JCM 10117 / KCTC 9821/ NBRC 16120 / NCIMB 702349 / NCTC 13040) OX=521096 GN=Tpau_3550 PE=4 SV=1 [Tsukamurella paurometabola]|uniref:Methylated-DNA/protein-cysteinemethyltransferase n=1 Tax=Tsukamurella paurometabola (strain ATCC 8368 / DSM 20162 / CCUG 35730 / CIP 100753 / JCM 10117 / KCTC 9821 / NBRC 16120 / NCIMB 702349 / NCTC 13040) TaxID=521096 RepID=D5UXB0_TSUPD|nr:methylated-DNA--[protein]-cysteine S-methyltransferase [Tsukamurella paurometabola]ADG80129.1 methylated-DNA/protein-cysteinemethyltransferase [Tsukamurella paurometabola DSM 20162]SUP38520.1 Methylated-DNA--protein-cysteine methyltransferase, constitutive [Tsukamurella paurometabola]
MSEKSTELLSAPADSSTLSRLSGSVPRILPAPHRLDRAARELDEYFEHPRKAFDLDRDLSLSQSFRQPVQRHLPEIGYGEPRSHREIAELVGNPGAVLAVGSACATNPLPVVVPCHRVVKSGGGVGQYVGCVEAKATALELDAA